MFIYQRVLHENAFALKSSTMNWPKAQVQTFGFAEALDFAMELASDCRHTRAHTHDNLKFKSDHITIIINYHICLPMATQRFFHVLLCPPWSKRDDKMTDGGGRGGAWRYHAAPVPAKDSNKLRNLWCWKKRIRQLQKRFLDITWYNPIKLIQIGINWLHVFPKSKVPKPSRCTSAEVPSFAMGTSPERSGGSKSSLTSPFLERSGNEW
jgi:hypothetical protein